MNDKADCQHDLPRRMCVQCKVEKLEAEKAALAAHICFADEHRKVDYHQIDEPCPKVARILDFEAKSVRAVKRLGGADHPT